MSSSQKSPHSSHVRVSYGVTLWVLWRKLTNHVIMRLNRISCVFSRFHCAVYQGSYKHPAGQWRVYARSSVCHSPHWSLQHKYGSTTHGGTQPAVLYTRWHHKQVCLLLITANRACYLVTVILGLVSWYPVILVKLLQLIWKLGIRKFNLQLPDLRVSCSDPTWRYGSKFVVPVISFSFECSLNSKSKENL